MKTTKRTNKILAFSEQIEILVHGKNHGYIKEKIASVEEIWATNGKKFWAVELIKGYLRNSNSPRNEL
jgi:hypothetical protein